VTVERKTGCYVFGDTEFERVDLPGTYSLDVAEDNVSIDERIACDYVAERTADLTVNIVDASNLEPNLYLNSQLLEMKLPMVALNMMDGPGERGIDIDVTALSHSLDCPVLPVVASTGKGIDELKVAILQAARAQDVPARSIGYADPIENAVARLLQEIEGRAFGCTVPAVMATRTRVSREGTASTGS